MTSGGNAEPTISITLMSLYYSIAAFGVLVLQATAMRLWRRGREKRLGDGIICLAEWGCKVRAAVVAFLIIFALLPIVTFVTAFALGGLLGAVEGWGFSDGYEYVIANILGVGPLVSLTPSTTFGTIMDVIISCWACLLGATILGVSASLALTMHWLATVRPTVFGLARVMLIDLPIIMLILATATGAFMAWVENWAFVDGFLYMVGALCGIQDPLTAVSPESDQGEFFGSICVLIELLLAGAVIGIMSDHPVIKNIIKALEGSNDYDSEQRTEGDASCLEGAKSCRSEQASTERASESVSDGGHGAAKNEGAVSV